jgi:hypothetical protein
MYLFFVTALAGPDMVQVRKIGMLRGPPAIILEADPWMTPCMNTRTVCGHVWPLPLSHPSLSGEKILALETLLLLWTSNPSLISLVRSPSGHII